MKNEMTLEQAISLATLAHGHDDQKDYSDKPYILHPLTVMLSLQDSGETLMMVAVLHDVVEDTFVTLDILRDKGFANDVVDAIDAITKRDQESYWQYLKRVKANPIACKVKLHDIKHNMSRLSNLEPDHAGYLAKKYTKALRFLGE